MIITGTNPLFFSIAVGVGIVGVLISSFRWMILLHSKKFDEDFLDVFAIYYYCSFINLYMPSTVGGDSIKAYLVGNSTENLDDAVASIIFERVAGLMAILFFGSLSVSLFPQQLPPVITYTLFFGLILLSSFFMVLFNSKIRKIIYLIINQIPTRVGSTLVKIYESIQKYRNDKEVIMKVVGVSLIFQLVPVINVYLLSRSIGINIPVIFIFILVSISQLISFLPISIAGFGVRETVYVSLLTTVGISPSAAVSLALLVGTHMIVKNLGGSLFSFKL